MRRHKSAKIGYQWNVRESPPDANSAASKLGRGLGWGGEIVDEEIIVHVTSSSPTSLHLDKTGEGDCQPKLLPRAFQVLPTTCNEGEVKWTRNSIKRCY